MRGRLIGVRARAAIAIITPHNKPSGRLVPTKANIQVVEQLLASGEVLGILLLDQSVITKTWCDSVVDCIARD